MDEELGLAIEQHNLARASRGREGAFFGTGRTPASSYDLRGSNFLARSVLKRSDLNSVNVTSANMMGLVLKESSFRTGVARGSIATDMYWNGTDFTGADFSDSDLSGSVFKRCNGASALFGRAVLTQARFWLSSLAHCSFEGASVENVALGNVDLSAVDLDGSRWDGTFGTVAEPSQSHPSWGGLDLVSALQARGAGDVRYWGWEQRR